MKWSEFKKQINDFAKKNGFASYNIFLSYFSSYGQEEYTIKITGRKSEPKSIECKGKTPKWCLRYLEKQFEMLTEDQEFQDIELD